MNFNLKENEYKISGQQSNELINMFGVETTLIKTQFVDLDKILGDFKNYSNTETKDNIYKIMLLPSTPEGFDNHDNILSSFGIMNLDNMDFFASIQGLEKIGYDSNNFNKIVGNLIVLPSNKVMEITNIITQVEGINNMFLYSYQKNVYKLSCKTYTYNHDEIIIPTTKESDVVVEVNKTDFESLDSFFDILEDKKEEKGLQDLESPLVKDKDPIFGDLG